MKRWVLSGLVAVTLLGCSKKHECERGVVQSSYVHKYGLTMSQDDWEARGGDGQVVTILHDGVTVTKNCQDGVLDGDTTYTFPHSQTFSRVETYRQGALAKQVDNFASGLPMREEEMTASGSNIVTSWYETGKPQAVEEYSAGRLVMGKYYDASGNNDAEVMNGEGTRKRRDGYGQLLSSDTIQNGEKVMRITYHPNGAPKEQTPYKNGLVNGSKKTFLPGGEPNTIESWVQGEQQGITLVYRNGEKYAEVPYQHGVKMGVERRYKDGSVLQEEITWFADQRQGPTNVYVNDVVQTHWYYQGKMVSKVAYEQLSHQV